MTDFRGTKEDQGIMIREDRIQGILMGRSRDAISVAARAIGPDLVHRNRLSLYSARDMSRFRNATLASWLGKHFRVVFLTAAAPRQFVERHGTKNL